MSVQVTQSRFFAVKTTGGQERTVANFVESRLQLRLNQQLKKALEEPGVDKNDSSRVESVKEELRARLGIRSIFALDTSKGYVYVEADNAQRVTDAVTGFKHVKSLVPGMMQFTDVERYFVTKDIIAELGVNDTVEVVAGPFKGMRAQIQRIEAARAEVTVILLDAPYQLPVTVDANYLKIVEKAKAAPAS